MPIRIIHVISGDLWAGAEVQMFHTLMQLHKNPQYNVSAVLFNEGLLSQRLIESKIPVQIINENIHNVLIMINKLRRLIKKEKPRIIHVHAYKEHILGYLSILFQRRTISLVRTFHGLTNVSKRQRGLKGTRQFIIKNVEDIVLNNSALSIIAVSKDLEKILQQTYPKARVHYIYNALPEPAFEINSPNEIRRKYHVTNQTFWIGTVGRLMKVKNFDLLIESARLLIKNPMKVKISIWGDGPLKDHLQKKINTYDLKNVIRLEGFENNIHSVLQAIDVFILCSRHEGMPMSLLEAMSLGTVPVCTSVGGMREIIKHGETGFLVPDNDPVSLANTVLDLYKNKQQRIKMAGKAIRDINSRYSINKATSALQDVYQLVLS